MKKSAFDPSDIGLTNGNLFGLPFTTKESEVVVIPVPWEVTVSYRDGTARGPETMLAASAQVDLYEPDIPDAWKLGIAMEPISETWRKTNTRLRKKAVACIANLAKGGSPNDARVKKIYAEINAASARLNAWVKTQSDRLLKDNKSVCVLGGEHSVSLGLIQALADRYGGFSILHIDAHADLREAYEGFEFSHASIMYNAAKISAVKKIVAVGIRDYSEQEANRIASSNGRMVAFTDRMLKRSAYDGATWKSLCEKITQTLSDNVYLSFDIDALDPSLCPHTGTPVPGGLEFEQVFYLLDTLAAKKKTIIGFDLSEVAPGTRDDWDSMVGARALYRLANLMAISQGKFKAASSS